MRVGHGRFVLGKDSSMFELAVQVPVKARVSFLHNKKKVGQSASRLESTLSMPWRSFMQILLDQSKRGLSTRKGKTKVFLYKLCRGGTKRIEAKVMATSNYKIRSKSGDPMFGDALKKRKPILHYITKSRKRR